MHVDFEWLDEPISVDIADKQLTSKPKTFYRRCRVQGTEYNMGDHILVANAEADDPESMAHCYVATIIYMYEMKSNKKDPFRAQVQWYSRVEQLPKKLLRSAEVDPPLDEALELVHEGQRYQADLSMETVFGKCSIILCDDSGRVPPRKSLGKQPGGQWVFFCRFALAPKTGDGILGGGFFVPVSEYGGVKLPEVKSAATAALAETASPARATRSARKSLVNEYEPTTPSRSTSKRTPARQPASSRRTPSRKAVPADDTLPSPLKNATFSVTTSSSKELRIVIQRCSGRKSTASAIKEEPPSVPSTPEPSRDIKSRARKKLDLEEETPTKIKEENEKTPPKRTTKRAGSATPSGGGASASKRRLKMTPSLSARSCQLASPTSPLAEIRRRLHVSAVPDTLPCREDEFQHIFSFVEGKLADGTGGCMYISGVPGTGKTATTSEVVRVLRQSQEEGGLPDFKLVEVNGMKLTTPQQIYVQIWTQLTSGSGAGGGGGGKVTAEKAAKLLQARFSSNGPRHLPTVMVVDELDLLWTRQQDVLYNIFEWPNRPKAQLTVLAIANTMDLPERLLVHRVASRMGLTRLTFQPYKVKQLQSIITSRLQDFVSFEPEAVEFIARKVSAASGDARRALDIARRAAELAEKSGAPTTPSKRGRAGQQASKSTVTMLHVQQAIEEMFSSPKFLAIQSCSLHEQLFLNALVQEFNRTGVEEAIFQQVVRQHYTLCDLEGMSRPNVSELLAVCANLSSCRLILSEHGRNDIRQKVRLNIGIDDVAYALKSAA